MDFFDCQLSPEFPYKAKPWNEAKHEPILVLHSSGTTGAPKPVVYQNGTLKGLDTAWRGEAGEMPLFDGMNGGFLYAPFPAFHSAGFLFMTVLPVFSQSTMVMPYAGENSAQNGHLALHIIKEKRTEMICVSPLVLKKISQCDEGVKILAGLKWVLYGGAPLPKSLGEHLSANGVNLVAIYGTTEATWIPTLLPASGHWDWLRFHPDAKIEWKQLENDEHTHELCFKNEGLAHNELRATHWTLKTDYWRSNDLFIRHPWKTDLWKYVGRKDDILVLAHAGMVNPVPVEDIIQSHPLIDGAIMAGAYRWPPCLLIEPRAGVEHHEKLRLDIWSIVEEANGILRQDNRIPMNKIMILAPNSLERNPKGGVVRYKSLRKHAETIQKCYAEDG
jgi:acyl-coenzyme A synthetase/AMP-(fatty) acid ligase